MVNHLKKARGEIWPKRSEEKKPKKNYQDEDKKFAINKKINSHSKGMYRYRSSVSSNEKDIKQFTYQGSSVSSAETDINTQLAKTCTDINRLSIKWKSDLTDKIKCIGKENN